MRNIEHISMSNHYFINSHDGARFLVQGFSETTPSADGKTFFRVTASKYGINNFEGEETGLRSIKTSVETRVISVCIPCFTEEDNALDRTLKSLREQQLPSGVVLEFLIVMDGIEKVSESMSAYIQTLLGFVDDGDEQPIHLIGNFFQQLPEAETIVVESINHTNNDDIKHGVTEGGISLILKRRNRRKVNSHMWWLGGHARDSGCEFALATDCGIIFEHTAIALMLSRLDQDQRLAAVTGFQRVMTATMQGDGKTELLKDPIGCMLRQIQRFDFEIDQSTTKSAFDSIGVMPVLPGPCGLYRFKELGDLKEGVMHRYFSLVNKPVNSLVCGNFQLTEDRILSFLLVFQNESYNNESNIEEADPKLKPRTGFVHDAVFYFEAEKPLSQLVKQRRRWNNGSIASYIWILREGWLWQGNQDLHIKIFATIFFAIDILDGAFIRLCGPAVMTVSLYTSSLVIPSLMSNSLEARVHSLYEGIAVQETSQTTQIIASMVALVYLIVYSIFMFGHTPRAVSIKNISTMVKYRSDQESAYHPEIFALASLANALAVLYCQVVPCLFIFKYGWAVAPLALRLSLLFLAIPYGVAFLDGMINSRCPNVTSILTMLWATPCFFLASVGFCVWLPAYSTARISDLSWGNRDIGGDEQDSKVAKHRAKIGKMVTAALVSSNFAVTGICICLLHQVSGSLQMIMFFSIGNQVLRRAVTFIDIMIRLVHRLVTVSCCIATAITRNVRALLPCGHWMLKRKDRILNSNFLWNVLQGWQTRAALAIGMTSRRASNSSGNYARLPSQEPERETKASRKQVCLFLIPLCFITLFMDKIAFSLRSPGDAFGADIFKKPSTVNKLQMQKLNFLAFGTSRTRGHGLLDPEKEAFIKLLSPRATNLAIPAGDVDYPSLCLSSLIGNQTFDVIVVESKANKHLFPFLHRLLVRLRNRFPDAPIIFLSVLTPQDYEFGQSSITVGEWMLQEGFRNKNDTHFVQHVLDTNASDWYYDDYEREEQRKVALSISNVHVVQFPSNWYPHDPRQFLIHNRNMFGDHEYPEHAWSHFSELGHQTIAQAIREKLAKLKHDVPWNCTGTWVGGLDQCESWFTTGKLGSTKTNMELVEFDDWNHKWALEVPPDGGYITISSSTKADVYVNHMKLYPERDQYPTTMAVLGNLSVELDPRFDYDMPGGAHVTSIAFISDIGPGVMNITFTPLEKGMANPFRVTGVVTTPRDEEIESA